MSEPSSLLTRQFLSWVAARPRTYGDVMEAWRSTCPRMTVWEDAVRDGLVRVHNGGAMRKGAVVLTARGRAQLKVRKEQTTGRSGVRS
jgi:hypothetical protein